MLQLWCAFANVISTTSKVYQIEVFQNSVFFMAKKLIKLKKLCKTLFWKKIIEHSGIFSENLFQHIAKSWWSLTWLVLVFRPSAPYFIKNAYIQILSMHEKNKVKKKNQSKPIINMLKKIVLYVCCIKDIRAFLKIILDWNKSKFSECIWPNAQNSQNVSTTPLRQWFFWQCLPFSWTTLRGKHCRHPIAVIGVVDTFRQWHITSCLPI